VDVNGQSMDILGSAIKGLRINANASPGKVSVSNSSVRGVLSGVSIGAIDGST